MEDIVCLHIPPIHSTMVELTISDFHLNSVNSLLVIIVSKYMLC